MPPPPWRRFAFENLQPWAKRALDPAYEARTRPRPKCSKEDFADGFVAALDYVKSASSFKPLDPEAEDG